MKTAITGAVVACVILGGCGDHTELDNPIASSAALTAPGAALLGLDKLSDWSSNQASLSLDTVQKTEGSASLKVSLNGWTEIDSRSFTSDSVGPWSENVGIDVYVPTTQPNPYWFGDLSGVLVCPTAGVYYDSLGTVGLTGLPTGQFSHLTLHVPASTVATLNASSASCQLRLMLNVNGGTGAWRLDHVRFEGAQSGLNLVDGDVLVNDLFVVAPGRFADTSWRYTTATPPSNWNSPSFADSGWSLGSSGFSSGAVMPVDVPRTTLPATLGFEWFRKTFTITSTTQRDALMLYGRWDDRAKVYLNGVQAAFEPKWTAGYHFVGISPEARNALVVGGTNVIAVEVENTEGGGFFDMGLVEQPDMLTRPVVGVPLNPALSAYTDMVQSFMIAHGIPSGVLAVMKGDDVMVNQSFGWKDRERTQQLPVGAILRLASNDKPPAVAGIRYLIDSHTTYPNSSDVLTNDTRVFKLLADHGLLDGAVPAEHVEDITVQQLLDHQSGLVELPDPATFYAAVGKSSGQTTAEDSLRYLYSHPLKFVPGSQSVYSSSGYFVLRHLMGLFGGGVENFLDDLLAPVGTSDFIIAHERLQDRNTSEPWYATLEASYDRWIYLDDFHALAASAEASVRFLRGYSFNQGEPLIDPVTHEWSPGSNNGYGVNFGGMAGTWSYFGQRRWDEVNIAVIFNIGGSWAYPLPNPDDEREQLELDLQNLTDSLPASAWVIQ